MSVAEPVSSNKNYEMKRSAMFSSSSSAQSSFSSQLNGAQPQPHVEVQSYSSQKQETTKKIGDAPAMHSESEHIKEYKSINGIESRNEKSTESSNISGIIDNHEKFNSSSSIPGLTHSLSNSSIIKSVRKTTGPRFISPMNGKIVDIGQDVVLEAIIEGHPTPNIKWSKNGVEIHPIPGKLSLFYECNKVRLELKNANTEDTGRYTCALDNPTGSAACTADVVVKKSIFPPVMCRRLLPQSIYVGDRLVMEAEIAGTPTPTIKWFKDGVPITHGTIGYRLREQGNSYAVVVDKASLTNSGTYRVSATNEGGEAISSADVRVSEKLSITQVPTSMLSQDLVIPPSLQTENQLEKHESFSNSSKFFKQNYSTQENLSVSKTLIKEDKHVNLKIGNEPMPLNMPYSIETSSSTTQKETIVPIQQNNTNYVENKNTKFISQADETHVPPQQSVADNYIERSSETHVTQVEEAPGEAIEQKPISKKCALDFFKNIIKENESEQNYLKETSSYQTTEKTRKEIPMPYLEKKDARETQLKESTIVPSYESTYEKCFSSENVSFPHRDESIPQEFVKNVTESSKQSSFEKKTWKPVSPIQQPLQTSFNEPDIYLEPGPPPEMCYVPKVAPKPKENFTDRLKKLNDNQRELSPVEVPSGGVKIFPDVKRDYVRQSSKDSDSGKPIYSEPPKPAYQFKPTTAPPSYNKSAVVEESCTQTRVDRTGPVLRPQADIHVRPTSPRPSAEGVSMEKLWTTKLHKESEVTRSASPVPQPPKPNVVQTTHESSYSEMRRCASPRPSAEGVKMEKLWSHSQHQHTPHPTSLMPENPKSPPPKAKDEDEESKRLAWSRKYLDEDSSPAPKPPAPQSTAVPMYAPPPKPVYAPPSTPLYTPPPQQAPAPPPKTPQYKPVQHVAPPHESMKTRSSSLDQSSSYKKTSFQSNQTTNAPWVKTETQQTAVPPPWVKSHSNQSFVSSEESVRKSGQVKKPVQYTHSQSSSSYLAQVPSSNHSYQQSSYQTEKQYSAPVVNSQGYSQSYSSSMVQEYQSGGQYGSSQPSTGYTESAVVEEHHLKPSLAKKLWPLTSETSNIQSAAQNYSSEPVTESSYSYEVSKTGDGYVTQETQSQKSYQEKKFSYPPPCRSSLKSKIQAFEDKSYHSDYESRFDSSDSEIRRTGSLKRSDRPSSVTSFKTLPKTFGRSNSSDYQTSSQTFRSFEQRSENSVIPGLKPGSPPEFLSTSSFRKGTHQDSGYMADTDDVTFEEKSSFKQSQSFGAPTRKSMSNTPQPLSPNKHPKPQRKHVPPPPRNPSRFVKGEFRESDYESDYETMKIKPKWRPYDSDTEEVTYRPVRPNLSAPKRRSFHQSDNVPSPLEFDRPPVVTEIRPHVPAAPVKLQKNKNISKNFYKNNVVSNQSSANSYKSIASKVNESSSDDFVVVKYSPNMSSTPVPVQIEKTSPKYYNHSSLQTYKNEPKVFEDTQNYSQAESGDNFHKSLHVQQTTRVVQSNGFVPISGADASLLEAERNRLQRVDEVKRKFEDQTMTLPSADSAFIIPPSVNSSYSNSYQSSEQFSQSFKSITEQQYYNSTQSQIIGGTGLNNISDGSHNFKSITNQGTNFGGFTHAGDKHVSLTNSYSSDLEPIVRKLPIFITPLRDIAVLSGQTAKFECIVQAEPTPSVHWSKDGEVLHPSHQYNIEFRNGVCRLTLPHAYPFDAGVYKCTAVNTIGTCETSATLTVPGEKRKLNL